MASDSQKDTNAPGQGPQPNHPGFILSPGPYDHPLGESYYTPRENIQAAGFTSG